MNSVAVIGLQWGDEGKGKIIDYLAPKYDCVVRFQGGSNAGHTIVKGGKIYKLSSLPSGIMYDYIISIIAAGVVIDPVCLFKEINDLNKQGIEVNTDKLIISENCHLILSLHKELDSIYEKNNKIGTTVRGIGTCYEDKIARRGIRVCDLYNESFLKLRIEQLVQHHNIIRKGSGNTMLNSKDVLSEVIMFRDFILGYTQSLSRIQTITKGKKILFEGAQGALLDIDYGTYPFVTSSSTIAVFNSGLAFPGKVLGVIKAYTTRVGNGPFITEQKNELGACLQKEGNEFGSITNRERRCGWFDAVAVKHAVSVTSATQLLMTKIDVLDKLPVIKICNNYSIGGKVCDYFPSSISVQEDIIPNYVELPGWQSSTAGLDDFEALPVNAKNYINVLEKMLGLPITIISTGKENASTILRQSLFA